MVKSFQQYLNENISTNKNKVDGNSMIWGDITEDHKIILDRNTKILKNYCCLPRPPSNSDFKTITELELLERISNSLKEEDAKVIEKYNYFINEFIEILDQFKLSYDKEKINELMKDIEVIILKEKFKFNRPRPVQLASKFGYELDTTHYNKSNSSKTPSYPSRHSSQSRFLASYFSEEYPLYKNSFTKLASEISMSRIKGLMHYPTDILAGELLGQHLYEQYKENNPLDNQEVANFIGNLP